MLIVFGIVCTHHIFSLYLSHDESLDKRCPIGPHSNRAQLSSLRATSLMSNPAVCLAHIFHGLKCHPQCLLTSSVILAINDWVISPAEKSPAGQHNMESLVKVSKIIGYSARNSVLLSQSEYTESDKKKTTKYV